MNRWVAYLEWRVLFKTLMNRALIDLSDSIGKKKMLVDSDLNLQFKIYKKVSSLQH